MVDATTWLNLENILSERNQIQVATYCMILANPQKQKVDQQLSEDGGRRKWEWLVMGGVLLGGVIEMFWNQVVVMVAQPCEYMMYTLKC